MIRRPAPPAPAVAALAALSIVATSLTGAAPAAAAPPPDPVLIVDNFEYTEGLPAGKDADGVAIGYSTFNGAKSSVTLANPGTPPAPVLDASPAPNKVLQVDLDVTSYAGVIHSFENSAVDTWVPQDWSEYAGFTMWLYGRGSGSTLFIDLLENRNPGSTKDDAQRWTVELKDDFTGWNQLVIPFSDFREKGVGNGAPVDDFERYEMHGWALGALGTGGPRTYYVDNVGVYGVGEVPPLKVSFAAKNSKIEEGTTGEVVVKLNRPWKDTDPEQVSVDYATEVEGSIALADREYTPVSGTLTFVKEVKDGGARGEQSFSIETFDDTKWEGDERIVLRLTDFVDVAPGGPSDTSVQGSVFIADNDRYDQALVDDFERGAYLWSGDPAVGIDAPDVKESDPLARPEQDDIEAVLKVETPRVVDIAVMGSTCKKGNGVIPVHLLSSPYFDATDVKLATVRFGEAREAHASGSAKAPTSHVADVNGDGRKDLVLHFRASQTGYDCNEQSPELTGQMADGTPFVHGDPAAFGRDFAIGQDWSSAQGLSFWYYGTGSGDKVTAVVKDNRAPDPGPSGWKKVWSDEFNAEAGTPPNPENWNFEIGDVTPDGKNGWGNDELQYYTDDPANAATDGAGNLALTLKADGSRECYYGTCEYTSARLTSWNKAEFAYGRIESRIRVPGGTGIWPAFWSLGTDIDRVAWPTTGEIDFMEYVGRLPNEIFGTIHGPGYAGGDSFGGVFDEFGSDNPAPADTFHTYSVEWGPDLIVWYINGIEYHRATPADVAPNEWVFNDPVFLLLNVAVGGNFGGPVGENLKPPSSMLVDYVRVYQGADTAERWETTFTDSEAGWQKVTVPFDSLTRSAIQPDDAPDDGLGLDEVWGYGFELPNGGTRTGMTMVDLVTLIDNVPPTVTIADDVADEVATGDVTFDFRFSEDVGASFTKDDIALAGGTKGAFARISGKHATLVAKPPADSTGTLEVSVAPGAFSDGAGNANTEGASATQDYSTPPEPGDRFVITFDEAGLNLIGFGGAEDSSVVADPGDAGNKVLKVVKNPPEGWAGTIVGTQPDGRVPVIPFSASDKTITARVWSPDVGIPVRLKVEANNPNVNVETEATTTVSGGWETLTFDFGDPVGAPVDLAAEYNRVVVFFDFGAGGDSWTARTYYLDDITWPSTGGGGGGGDWPTITFDEAGLNLIGFGGAEDSSVVADPTDAANKVAKVVKAAGAQVWAGTIVGTQPDGRVPVIPFSASDKTITARVWSPDAGIPVRLKVEADDPNVNVETEATTTVSGGWETLTFDFGDPVGAPVDLAAEYNRVVVFFDFGTAGSGKTYYLDDITWP